MASQEQTQRSILIIGAGCFGLATAYSLASAGYTDITVLEKDDFVPSLFSAANDLNKVIRAEYADTFYTDIALSAIRKWQTDPLFMPHFHQTGFLNVTSAAAEKPVMDVIEKYLSSIEGHPSFAGKVRRVTGEADVRRLVPSFRGPIAGWTGYFNELAGYAHSADALRAVYEACAKLGVKFCLGRLDGEVEALLYASGSSDKFCIGAQTWGKKVHRADTTILALGASVARLVPQIGPQVAGRCWGVIHIQLTPEEAAKLEGIPVTNVRDLAFFFEPDMKTHKLKFCHMGGGFTNYAASKDGLSLPFEKLADSEFVPLDDEYYIRRLLREVLPQFADRPFIDAHLCWFADTSDSDFIIDYVPGTGSSLVVLSGDSGHGFKMLPIFGAFTKELLEKGSQKIHKWQWKKPSEKKSSNSASWRSDATGKEIADIARAKL